MTNVYMTFHGLLSKQSISDELTGARRLSVAGATSLTKRFSLEMFQLKKFSMHWQLVAVVIVLLSLPWLNPYAPGPSPAVVPWLFSWFCVAVSLFFLMSNLASAKRLAVIAAMSWLMDGLASSGIGLLQYFGAVSDANPWINQTHYGEAFANLRQRNQFASLTNMALVALVWLMLQTQALGSDNRPGETRLGWLALLAAGLLAVGNAISSSRTGLFQVVLICAWSGLWGYWRHALVRRILLWAVLVYGVAVFAMPYLAGLDLSTHGLMARLGKDDACGSRLTLWSNVLHLIAQRPWLGWGWGELDFAHFITPYNEPRFCDILDNAHNLPLHLAVELGVPAAVLICAGFLYWAVRQKPWAEPDATRQMAWAVIAVILLHSMLEYPLWYGPFQVAFGVCVLLLWRQKPDSEPGNSTKKEPNRSPVLILYASSAIFLIAFTTYAMWDYRRISQIYLPPESRDVSYRSDTLSKIRGSWLFADQVRFAELMTTPLTQTNAAWTFKMANNLLHYSPEPRVIERLIDSAVMLGRDEEAVVYLARYRAAFPKEHAAWAMANKPAN